MRNQHQVQAKGGEEVEPLRPVQVRTHFVDFIDRQRVAAGGQGPGAGEDQRRSEAVAGAHRLPHQRALEVAGGVGRAAWPQEEDVGVVQLCRLLRVVRAVGAAAAPGRHGECLRGKILQPLLHKAHHLLGHIAAVWLKAGGRLQHGHAHLVAAVGNGGKAAVKDLLRRRRRLT